VIERAWRLGARFDGWHEHFRPAAWRQAFREAGIDPEPYAYRDLDPASPMPWHVIHSGVNRKWLALELRRALAAGTLSVCGPTDCHGCAPFARDCVKGVVARTTGRALSDALPVLGTPSAAGPGSPVGRERAPRRPTLPSETTAAGDSAPVRRYRARFEKTGRLRFLGHLDLTRLLMRALRRAGWKLVYSRGFNPKPRIGFGPALAVGIASEAEYVDFDTYVRLSAGAAEAEVNRVLPAGLRFLAIREIPPDEPSLGEAVRAARYRMSGLAPADLARALDLRRRADTVSVERPRNDGRARTFRLGDELLALEAVDSASLRVTLALHGDGPSLRPDELVPLFSVSDARGVRIVREDVLVEREGRLVDPLAVLAPPLECVADPPDVLRAAR
jgi:radical SAM-linked protein